MNVNVFSLHNPLGVTCCEDRRECFSNAWAFHIVKCIIAVCNPCCATKLQQHALFPSPSLATGTMRVYLRTANRCHAFSHINLRATWMDENWLPNRQRFYWVFSSGGM